MSRALRPSQDAFGAALWDYYRGGNAPELIERDDGWLDTGDLAKYFAPFRAWPAHERAVMRQVRGRVLDVGCGAGRHALWLQQRGHDVLGIDVSPGAIALAKERGVRRARVLPVSGVSRRLGRFESIVMLGNNFGLMASRQRARWLLGRFRAITSPGAVIAASTLDATGRGTPAEHRRYHARNRARGRLPGQIRLRCRLRGLATPWFDYLFVSRRELRDLVRGSGWRVADSYDGPGPLWAFVLEREDSGD